MTPGLKYTLARFGLFVVCTLPAVLFLPATLDLLLRILIGAVISALLSLVLLKGLRDQMAEQISSTFQNRRESKDKLRAALAGEDDVDVDVTEPTKSDESGPTAR